MTFDPAAFTRELFEALDARQNAYDEKVAARLCDRLISHLRQRPDIYPVEHAVRILRKLRSKRFFATMERVAVALVQSGQRHPEVRRQHAQSLLDQGAIDQALEVLHGLVAEQPVDSIEGAEARGLIGRAFKQRYVDEPANPEWLRKAAESYFDVYKADSRKHVWPGINVVALLSRAKKEGVALGAFPDPAQLARDILGVVEGNFFDERATTWDFGTAVEACVALDDAPRAAQWLDRYLLQSTADAFELFSTHRQLVEVWKLTPNSNLGRMVLMPLRAALARRQGGHQLLGPAELQARADFHGYEAHFSPPNYLMIRDMFEKVLPRSRSIARVGVSLREGAGTGFLISGSFLHPALGETVVFLTNSHVISQDEEVFRRSEAPPLRWDNAVITFRELSPGSEAVEYHVRECLWESPPWALDVIVLVLDKPVPGAEPQPVAKRLPAKGEKQESRVFVVGHPGKRELCTSLEDNVLLDHDRVKVHYRTQTEGGSSGSPVFNTKWEVIAIHHKGDKEMPRLNGREGTYEANEGISLLEIRDEFRKRPSTEPLCRAG